MIFRMKELALMMPSDALMKQYRMWQGFASAQISVMDSALGQILFNQVRASIFNASYSLPSDL
jgi:hypothetical protein